MQPFISNSLADQYKQDEALRLQRWQRAYQSYHGLFPSPLKRKRDQPDDNVITNFARLIVDKSVAFLFGRGVEFELDETAETDAEEWLEQCWRENKKKKSLHA